MQDKDKKKEPKTSYRQSISLSFISLFILLTILIWLNELFDLPHLLLGASHSPINWQEAILETILVLAVGFIAVAKLAYDTNKLKMAEKKLISAKESAESATRAKSDFLANMSHEIRTPMNGVIAATDLALSEKVSPKIENYLKIIHTSAYSLLGLINDILDFSKIEAGKLEPEIRSFWLDEVLDSVVEMFIKKTAEKRIEILVDICPEVPIALIGDSLRLRQILTNLLDNAVKFTPGSGVILVGVKDIKKSSNQVTLKFFVKDTGIGIAPGYLDQIFNPFSQGDGSTTRKYGGTGLGLSICQKLIELMKGRIWAESELGKGSTFFFTITFQRQQNVQEQTYLPPLDLQGLKVLVVDDCADSRSIIQKMLESFGFRITAVSNGRDSLVRLKAAQTQHEPFELIFIDWLMPELDGIKTAREIRQNLKITTPIILMTAFSKESEISEAEKVGVNAFLTKPIYPSILFNTIMDTFGKKALKSIKKNDHIMTKASVYKNRLQGIRILIAEDNPTNQEIALAILEDAGITAEIAKNGKEAVEAVQKGRFDAVLMDIQMPEMDGYEATRTMRRDSRFKSLPIIAMTAHAMKGDEEKCLKAGMDGYISKPINQDRLFYTIWKSIKHQKRKESDKEPEKRYNETDKVKALRKEATNLPAKVPGINIQEALNALNLDPNIFKRILSGFFENNQETMNKIRAAATRNDWESLHLMAHNLKGSAANIRADDLQTAAQELETAFRQAADRPPASNSIEKLDAALNQVLKSIQLLTDTSNIGSSSQTQITPTTRNLISRLKRLENALNLANPEEIQKSMKDIAPDIDQLILHDLETQIKDYEYEEALEILKGVEGELVD
ncbi:MAG: response regulator [Desulfobacterales bacterium]|nr:response regulator [Desulfobacterales bacterium]